MSEYGLRPGKSVLLAGAPCQWPGQIKAVQCFESDNDRDDSRVATDIDFGSIRQSCSYIEHTVRPAHRSDMCRMLAVCDLCPLASTPYESGDWSDQIW